MIWFDRQAARDVTATLALRVRVVDRRKPLTLGLRIDRGRFRVNWGAPPAPGATATVHAADLARLALGVVGWPQLLAAGRLELTGDPFLALRFPGLFRLPASAPRGDGRRLRRARRVDASAL
jgi:hypothetical protein